MECLNYSNVSETVREYNTSKKNVTRWKGRKVNIMHTLNYLINVHLGISVHPGICYRN